MDPILSATKLRKRFGDSGAWVVQDLAVAFAPGEFSVIMGSSGSGKSTLLYLLCGLDRPTDGEVSYDGKEISRLSENDAALMRRRAMGFVFQDSGLVPQLTLLENVAIPGCLVDKNRAKVVERARGLMERTGIAALADRLPAQVSGGEQQRCAIARALINSPAVIFADEPTGNLNSSHSSAVLDLLSELNAGGQTIVMVTHELKAACRGKRVLFLRDGEIRAEHAIGDTPLSDRERVLFDWLTRMGW